MSSLRVMGRILGSVSLVAGIGVVSLSAGCSGASGSGGSQGAAGAACYPNGTCNSGLACTMGTCVEDGASSSGGGGGDDGGNSSGGGSGGGSTGSCSNVTMSGESGSACATYGNLTSAEASSRQSGCGSLGGTWNEPGSCPCSQDGEALNGACAQSGAVTIYYYFGGEVAASQCTNGGGAWTAAGAGPGATCSGSSSGSGSGSGGGNGSTGGSGSTSSGG